MLRCVAFTLIAVAPAVSVAQTTGTDQRQPIVPPGELRLRILLTSAADEQYRGSDPKSLAADHRMVDNASDLAARLAGLNPSTVTVVRTIFEGETHGSVWPVSLTSGLRFALALN